MELRGNLRCMVMQKFARGSFIADDGDDNDTFTVSC